MTREPTVIIRNVDDIKWSRLIKDSMSRELLKFAFAKVIETNAWDDVANWDGSYFSVDKAGVGVQKLEQSIFDHPEGLSGAGVSWVLSRTHELCTLGVNYFAAKRTRKAPRRFKPY